MAELTGTPTFGIRCTGLMIVTFYCKWLMSGLEDGVLKQLHIIDWTYWKGFYLVVTHDLGLLLMGLQVQSCKAFTMNKKQILENIGCTLFWWYLTGIMVILNGHKCLQLYIVNTARELTLLLPTRKLDPILIEYFCVDFWAVKWGLGSLCLNTCWSWYSIWGRMVPCSPDSNKKVNKLREEAFRKCGLWEQWPHQILASPSSTNRQTCE